LAPKNTRPRKVRSKQRPFSSRGAVGIVDVDLAMRLSKIITLVSLAVFIATLTQITG
jgi:hypothetical protein